MYSQNIILDKRNCNIPQTEATAAPTVLFTGHNSHALPLSGFKNDPMGQTTILK